ncbi:MAG: DNA polymerase III subunit delta [Treponema sp.]|jgi:DNA polymerase-3 subunit delta|nr:DNA polymerase III subunit delta [Treponema sp.]
MAENISLSAKDIEAGCCFLFLGPELGEKDDAVQAIRRSLNGVAGGNSVAGGSEAAEESSFYAGETPVNAISAILRNGSLFADTRLFLIKYAELIDARKKDETELLTSYIKSPQPRTVVILLSDETKIAKTIEDAVPAKNKRIFWELFENRKIDWVRDFFKREGCRINEEGIATILELVENNTEALKQECGRLVQFFGKDRLIGEEEAEEWLSHTREESSFTLFSRIAAGDLSKSLESLHALLGSKESFQSIFGGLCWCFRRLRDYQALLESGRIKPSQGGGYNQGNDFEFRKIGLGNVKARGAYIEADRRYGQGAADRFLALAAEYDIRLRAGGAALETLLLEMFLCKILAEAGGNTR